MRLAIAALLLTSTPALAQEPLGIDPSIRGCNRISQHYSAWALDYRRLLEYHSSDRGGRVDQSLIMDINFALVSVGDFVHTNIQTAQRTPLSPRDRLRMCFDVTAEARAQIEQYARRLFSEVHPTDRWGRESLRRELRVGLSESTYRFSGY